MGSWTTNRSKDNYRLVVQKAITYINENLASDIDLEQVAKVASLSMFHFHRIFSALQGETLSRYVNRVRLERAANWLIKNPSASITEIAFTCGFSSSAAFSRSFKDHFGMPASRFRDLKSGEFKRLINQSRRPDIAMPAKSLKSWVEQIHVREMPHYLVAYVANMEGYNLQKICASWNKIIRWGTTKKLIDSQTLMIGVSFDDPFITPQDRCRYYACITVPEKPPPNDKVGWMEISAGKYAVCRIECFAEEIAPVYHALYGEWLPESGFLPANMPSYEIYYQMPETHPEHKYVFDICLPVE
jgi:AraC family transcriptional regulator